MYNLHCHSLQSDGCLLPSEIAVRYAALGYKGIAITDHADYSNIEQAARCATEFVKRWPKDSAIKVFAGTELTHLPPEQFAPLVKKARCLGLKVVIGHGETPVEPVTPGTNRAAILAKVDILAHPGLITDEDTKLAKKMGVFLEVTTRRGHSETNRHVIKQALKFGAKMILNHDSHRPEDIISPGISIALARKSGLTQPQIDKIQEDTERFLQTREGKC